MVSIARKLTALIGLCWSLILPSAFAQAQQVSQSELCSFEANTQQSEQALIAAFRAETNPIKKDGLQQQYQQLSHKNFDARRAFFNVPPVTRGSKSFVAFVGKVKSFTSDKLHIVIACPQAHVILWAYYQIPDWTTASSPTITDLNRLRSSLEQIKVGDVVIINGVVFFGGFDGESFEADEAMYKVKITDLRRQ